MGFNSAASGDHFLMKQPLLFHARQLAAIVAVGRPQRGHIGTSATSLITISLGAVLIVLEVLMAFVQSI